MGVATPLGLALGLVTARYLNSILARFPGLPERIDFFLFQPRAAWTALGLLVASGILSGIYPSWRGASLGIAATLAAGGSGMSDVSTRTDAGASRRSGDDAGRDRGGPRLVREYRMGDEQVHALRGVSFTVTQGSTWRSWVRRAAARARCSTSSA